MMDDGLLSLKWNNHKSTFLHKLGLLHDKAIYTDVTLACDGSLFPAHRLVLSTCSDYLAAILESTQCRSPVIVLKDIKKHQLTSLLRYMYLGQVDVRQSDLGGLIKAAECLEIKGLAVSDQPPTNSSHTVTKNKERPPQISGGGSNNKRSSDLEVSNEAKRTKQTRDVADSSNNHVNLVTETPLVKEENLSDEEIIQVRNIKVEDADIKLNTNQEIIQDQLSDNTYQQNDLEPLPPDLYVEKPTEFAENWYAQDYRSSDQNDPSDHIVEDRQAMVESSFNENGTLLSPTKDIFYLSGNQSSRAIYCCPYCGKNYYQNCFYKRHLRTHTGEKPYECKLCDYKAALSSNLYRHLRTKHNT